MPLLDTELDDTLLDAEDEDDGLDGDEEEDGTLLLDAELAVDDDADELDDADRLEELLTLSEDGALEDDEPDEGLLLNEVPGMLGRLDDADAEPERLPDEEAELLGEGDEPEDDDDPLDELLDDPSAGLP